MAIEIQLSDTNPFTAKGLTTKQDIGVITRGKLEALIPKAFDTCAFECDYIEMAFAEFGGVIIDEYKNDKTDLLFQLLLVTDSVTIKLFKCVDGAEVEQATLNDNTYGTYYAPADFPDSLKVGFVADWNTIYDTLGGGIYFFRAERTIIGESDTIDSHKFNCCLFNEERADDTIKVVTNQTGCIEGGFDYTGFNWVGYVRLYGYFGKPEFTHTKEDFIDSNRNIQQIQESIRTIYSMELKLHPSSVVIPFIKDRLLANAITITPYGIFDFLERYKEIEVATESIEESKYFAMNSKSANRILFTDRNQTPIKRRFS